MGSDVHNLSVEAKRSQFSSSIVWVQGLELRSSHLNVSVQEWTELLEAKTWASGNGERMKDYIVKPCLKKKNLLVYACIFIFFFFKFNSLFDNFCFVWFF